MSRAILIFALVLGASAAMAADSSGPGGYYGNPARDIEFSNVQHLSRSPRIALPAVYVRFARWGRAPLRTGTSSTEGAVIDVDAPVPVDTIRELTTRLQDDLVAQLKSAGWEVMTYAQIKDNAVWAKLPRVDPDRRFGVPFEQSNIGGNQRRYLVVTPANAPVIAAGATGPAWAMKDLVAELNATVLVATYTIDVVPSVPSPAMVAAQPGIQPVVPHLQLVDVNLDFRTPGMVGGSIHTRIAETSTEGTGKFSVPGVKDDKRQKALEEAAIGKGKGELALEPDAGSFVSTAMALAGAFNTKVVQTISVYAPK